MVNIAHARLRPLLLDTLLAVLFGVAIMAATTGQGHHLGSGQLIFIWSMAVPLAFRRQWPLQVLAATTGVAVLYALLSYPGGPIYLAVILALYTVATRLSRTQGLILAAASMGAVFVGVVAGQGMGGLQLPIHAMFASWGFAVVFIGDAARNRGRYVDTLKERARLAEETREEEARRRVAEERVRIARDIHDVMGHSLATITVQAAAGSRVFETDPERAREALAAIRETSKLALRDLSSTLSLLRPGDEDAPLDPAPGVADFRALLSAPATAGIEVKADVQGEPYDLPSAVDIAAYRILQESLTNVVRHANASRAAIALRYEPAFLEVEVLDNGVEPAHSPNGHGHGLAGMRERAESLGGTFAAGPVPSGGFRVWTRLPTGGAA